MGALEGEAASRHARAWAAACLAELGSDQGLPFATRKRCAGRRPSHAVVPVQRLRSQLGMEGLVLQPAEGGAAGRVVHWRSYRAKMVRGVLKMHKTNWAGRWETHTHSTFGTRINGPAPVFAQHRPNAPAICGGINLSAPVQQDVDEEVHPQDVGKHHQSARGVLPQHVHNLHVEGSAPGGSCKCGCMLGWVQ